jgi:endoglucanase
MEFTPPRSPNLPCLMGAIALSLASLSKPCLAGEPWPMRVGVSLAGPEFGMVERNLSNLSPGVHGVDYLYNSPTTSRRVAESGFQLVRVPFRWERIQPILGAPLDPAELGRLEATVDLAAEHGLKVILDLHNYCRYRVGTSQGVVGAVVDAPIDGKPLVRRDHLADLWLRLARQFRDHSGVLAYGIMNEPHDMGSSSWKEISQVVVDAVRSVDMQTWVCVAGDGWSHADRFEEINGPRAWIRDPSRRTAYEAHCYFDFDRSGRYRLSYDDELHLDKDLVKRGHTRIASFIQWLDRNDAHGIVGEVGVPIGDHRWITLMTELSRNAQRHGIPLVVWAAGEWWNDYPLSIQPLIEPGKPTALEGLGLSDLIIVTR